QEPERAEDARVLPLGARQRRRARRCARLYAAAAQARQARREVVGEEFPREDGARKPLTAKSVAAWRSIDRRAKDRGASTRRGESSRSTVGGNPQALAYRQRRAVRRTYRGCARSHRGAAAAPARRRV